MLKPASSSNWDNDCKEPSVSHQVCKGVSSSLGGLASSIILSFSLSLTRAKQPHKWELRIFSLGAGRSLPPRSKLWSSPIACSFEAWTRSKLWSSPIACSFEAWTRTRGGLSMAKPGFLATLMGSSNSEVLVEEDPHQTPDGLQEGKAWQDPPALLKKELGWATDPQLLQHPHFRGLASSYWYRSLTIGQISRGTNGAKASPLRHAVKPKNHTNLPLGLQILPISVGPTVPIWTSL